MCNKTVSLIATLFSIGNAVTSGCDVVESRTFNDSGIYCEVLFYFMDTIKAKKWFDENL
jgi:hypothetical protein